MRCLSVLFAKHQALIVLSLYVLGIICAFITAKILSKTILKNERSILLLSYHRTVSRIGKRYLEALGIKEKVLLKKLGHSFLAERCLSGFY